MTAYGYTWLSRANGRYGKNSPNNRRPTTNGRRFIERSSRPAKNGPGFLPASIFLEFFEKRRFRATSNDEGAIVH